MQNNADFIEHSRYNRNKSKSKIKVFEVVRKIPRGSFLTYKEVAEKAGFPRVWRAVGNILNKNTNPKIPCHRIIRSDGKVGGFNRGKNKKIALLKKEGIMINHGKVTS